MEGSINGPMRGTIRVAHFEAASGIAGDMTVAALLDAGRDRGLSVEALAAALACLPLGHYRIEAPPQRVDGIAALGFRVHIEHQHHDHHRHWRDIRAMLEQGLVQGFPAGAFERAVAIFQVLAEAEAEVHGVAVDDVHFHEVGAVDSIVDIAGAAWCLDRLGIDCCTVAPLPTGSGFVDTEHGRLAVPAPATARLLRGFDVKAGDGDGELVTPTGAAILAACARPMLPVMHVEAVGSGAGTKRLKDRPNVLRVFLGTMQAQGAADGDHGDALVLLEADVDDLSPAALAFACERLRAEGARDVSVQAIQMKKGRLGMRVTVLCDAVRADALATALLLHTSSLGVRFRSVARRTLARRIDLVDTPFGKIRVKVAMRPDGTQTAEPEFEDVAARAIAAGSDFAQVRASAIAAHAKLQPL